MSTKPSINGLGVEFAREESRRRSEDGDDLAQLRLEPIELGLLDVGDPFARAVVDIGIHHLPAHGLVANDGLAGNGR